ncbi:MAG: hypothetical protein P4N59_22560 [Negativicutes bacterium]|nr:hypothetical protein [Negativicutes bacterium]
MKMKKLFVLLAVLVAATIFPLAAYASDHDQGRQEHHEHMWKDHEQEWKEHDREWREHSHNRHWREEHAKEWHDWYQWHQDNEKEFHLHISEDGFDLEIGG